VRLRIHFRKSEFPVEAFDEFGKQVTLDRDGIPVLAHREEEVVRLVSDGMKNREIAEALQVKEHSIRNYIYRIFEKLGVSSRVELILYALSQMAQATGRPKTTLQ
jgi:DNA-binding CsgD family transcriptional regulator